MTPINATPKPVFMARIGIGYNSLTELLPAWWIDCNSISELQEPRTIQGLKLAYKNTNDQ